MTTGIFLNILAGATEEAIAQGRRPVAPYWRVVDEAGRMPPKFPPGPTRQAEHLRAEGHAVSRDGKVRDVEAKLLRR
jgi:alkylated DNA nucleotide flippase Atl1